MSFKGLKKEEIILRNKIHIEFRLIMKKNNNEIIKTLQIPNTIWNCTNKNNLQILNFALESYKQTELKINNIVKNCDGNTELLKLKKKKSLNMCSINGIKNKNCKNLARYDLSIRISQYLINKIFDEIIL